MSVYETYAIKYAHHARTAKENFLGGDPHDGPMPMDYFVWAIVGDGGPFPMARHPCRGGSRPRGAPVVGRTEDS